VLARERKRRADFGNPAVLLNLWLTDDPAGKPAAEPPAAIRLVQAGM